MRTPFWIKLSLVLGLGITIATWFSGEATRKLDSEFLLETARRDMQRTASLLSALLTDPVIVGDSDTTASLIRQYAAGWENITYIHVLDDDGLFVAEWQKKPIKFGPGIRKFEQPVEHGGQHFGILSMYVDMGDVYEAIDSHVDRSRRQSALMLLSLTLFIVFIVNYLALRENQLPGPGADE